MNRNVTLTIDENLLRAARRVALDRQTSVHQMVRDHLTELVGQSGTRMQRSRPAVSGPDNPEAPWLGSVLQMRGLGRALWKNEDADEYVHALRDDWTETPGE